jgi:hypothetical protein
MDKDMAMDIDMDVDLNMVCRLLLSFSHKDVL